MTLPIRRRDAEGARAPAPELVATIADRLLAKVDPKDRADRALRRLLERALTAAAESERRLAAQRVEIERLRRLSITDEATGLLNRRGFAEALGRAVQRARRYGEPGALLLIDLDGFKATNDTHGHAAGDRVLAVVADALRGQVRAVDDVARIGGDEFAVVLYPAPRRHAATRAAAIEAVLNSLTVSWRGCGIPIRASVGSHCFGADADAEDVFARADGDMYLRKNRRASGQGRLLHDRIAGRKCEASAA